MRLSYERRGEGEPLLLIHGLGGEWRVWGPVLDPLARQRDVIAIDLPGFGDSPKLDEDPTAVALAHTVAGFLAELGVPAPHVAGNSLGGWVALELAALGGARSVTALSPAGLWPRPLGPKAFSSRGAARRLLPIMPWLLRTRRGRRLVLSQTVAHPERVPPEDALRMVRSYALAPGFDAANAAMRRGRFDEAARLHVPVTLAWGEHDRLVRRQELDAPGARTVVLRDCGHIPMWDDPEEISRVLLAGSAGRRAQSLSRRS